VEINQRARELDAKEDVAVFYDKTKIGEHYLKDIKEGKYKWIYLNPEKALHPHVFDQLWESVEFRSKILLFAVDEAHLVSEWYVA